MFDWHMFFRPKVTIGAAPIIVNLEDVKLAEMTNLPPKAVFGEEEKKATVAEKTKPQYTTEEKPVQAEPEQKAPKKETIKEDFVDTEPEPKKPEKKEPQPTPKEAPKPIKKPIPPAPKKPIPPAPKKPASKPKAPEKPKEIATVKNSLKSLMESVNSLEKEVGKETAPAVIKTGTVVQNMGVDGGTGGSYFSDLTITETDAIAGKLRECWNFDPGAQNIENMIIEIRAFLNKDGTIRDVKIVDSSRANSDPRFRAIAESARRAVLSAQNYKGVNIYKIFADKYPDKYKLWSTLLLKFNPMDASVQ